MRKLKLYKHRNDCVTVSIVLKLGLKRCETELKKLLMGSQIAFIPYFFYGRSTFEKLILTT